MIRAPPLTLVVGFYQAILVYSSLNRRGSSRAVENGTTFTGVILLIIILAVVIWLYWMLRKREICRFWGAALLQGK